MRQSADSQPQQSTRPSLTSLPKIKLHKRRGIGEMLAANPVLGTRTITVADCHESEPFGRAFLRFAPRIPLGCGSGDET
jgi:hypothetical protein